VSGTVTVRSIASSSATARRSCPARARRSRRPIRRCRRR